MHRILADNCFKVNVRLTRSFLFFRKCPKRYFVRKDYFAPIAILIFFCPNELYFPLASASLLYCATLCYEHEDNVL